MLKWWSMSVPTASFVFPPIRKSADFYFQESNILFRLSGISPFAGDDVMETYANIGMVDYDFDCEEFDEISETAIDFIEKLLVRSPKLVYYLSCLTLFSRMRVTLLSQNTIHDSNQ